MDQVSEQTIWIRCLVCNAEATSTLMTCRGYRIARCCNCSFIFVNPRPTEECLIRLYANRDSNPFFADHYEPLAYEAPVLSKIMRKIQTYVRSGAMLLEVGCGRGDFLRVAQRQGFSGTGCDIFGGRLPVSEGIVFFDGTLQEAKFPDNAFDVVVVRNIFEHLFNPNAEIQEIRRILKRDGYLYLKVPNVDFEYGLRCRFMFGKQHTFDPPYHLNHFSPISLQRFLCNADFTLITWYLEQPTLQAKWSKNLARQTGYRVFQTLGFLSGGVVFPKPLLSCLAQKK